MSLENLREKLSEPAKRRRGRPRKDESDPKWKMFNEYLEGKPVNDTSTLPVAYAGNSNPVTNGHASDPISALGGQIADIIRSQIQQGPNETKIRELIRREISAIPPKVIEIKSATSTATIEGQAHYMFPLVLKALASGCNVAMSGSTATSKTTMALQAAKALGKDCMLFRPMHSPSQAEGYNSAIGEYIQSNLYRAHKAGMMAIFDEFDASDPMITLILNPIMDNKTFTYPNGETVSNPDFQIVFTMNTTGKGPDRKFVGRTRLDAATLERFVLLEVEHDNSLEASLLGIVEKQPYLHIEDGGTCTAQEWLDIVREQRAEYKRTHPDKIISMRATRDGWKLMQAGIGKEWALKMTVHR